MRNPVWHYGLVAALLSFLVATPANAAPPTDESIDALLVAQRVERNLGLVLQSLEQLKQEAVRIELKDKELSSDQQQSLNAQMETCLSAVREEASWENLRPMYRQVYKEVFSQDEIDGLIAFYKSPVGVALLEKQPIVLQKTTAIVLERMAGWREKFQATAKQALETSQLSADDRGVTSDNAEQLAESRLRHEAAQIATRTDGWLQLNYETLSKHADTIAMRSMLPELQRPVLIAIANDQPWTQLAFTIGLDGVSVTRSDSLSPINYADRVYFKTAAAGQPLGQQILISRTTNRPVWVVAVPIKDEAGKVVGVLAKTNGLNELTDQLANAKIGDTGRAILIAPGGRLVGMTGAVFEKELRDWSKHPLFLARENIRGGVLRYLDDGRAAIAVLQPVRFGWLVAVQMDEAEALRPLSRPR